MALILLIAPKPRNKSRLKDQIALHKILAKRTVVSEIFSETDTCNLLQNIFKNGAKLRFVCYIFASKFSATHAS